MSQLQWVDENREAIEARQKKAVGRVRRIAEMNAAMDSAIELLKQCRAWQRGAESREALAGVEARGRIFRESAARE
jgi:hypothetical protein